MKIVKHLVLATLLLSGVGTANAGICAVGYIKKIAEGGWNYNDLMINIEYVSGSTPPTWWPTSQQNPDFGYMRFRSTLDPTRLSAIRTLAYMALANGNKVEVRTTSKNASNIDDCTKADELKGFRETS